ncbi:MAG: PhnD/SsuA/transferrin family substrate-binding protein [Chloroflexi bacterium]|nr:PhnD/SsuA/transferrin family substrate-binding protein [Chloroflexota bacterium]
MTYTILPKSRARTATVIGIFLLLGLFSACKPSPSPTAATPTGAAQTSTLAPFPTSIPTPTPAPLGDPNNPVLMGIVSANNDSKATDAADQVAAAISTETGYTVRTSFSASYPDLIGDLRLGKIHFAWLPPFTYIQAHEEEIADVALVVNHFGVYSYGSQFLANAEHGFKVYYDATTGQSTAGAANALVQLAGTRPCWVDPTSASGYVVPDGILAQESIQTLDPVFTQDPGAVIRALYTKGICDFGATYAVSGDPRTASSIQADLPDVMNKVIVLWQTDAIIPNMNVSFHQSVSQAVRQKIADSLVDLARKSEGKTILTTAMNYDVSGFKAIDDTYYDPLRSIVQASGIDLAPLIGK